MKLIQLCAACHINESTTYFRQCNCSSSKCSICVQLCDHHNHIQSIWQHLHNRRNSVYTCNDKFTFAQQTVIHRPHLYQKNSLTVQTVPPYAKCGNPHAKSAMYQIIILLCNGPLLQTSYAYYRLNLIQHNSVFTY